MKMKLFYMGFVILIVGNNKLYGQVDLQTGAAQFSLPLYNYNDLNNRLTTTISLNYTSGNGLKVSEMPSSVGSGWNLSCGGVIQRIQSGERDDQKNNDTYIYPLNLSNLDQELQYLDWAKNYFPNGYIYSEFPASELTTNGARVSPLLPSNCYLFKPRQKYLADKEQDVFMFSFEGRHGFFIISKPDINGISQIKTLLDSKLKINIVYGDLNNTENIRTTISEFHITDESGIKYIFKEADLTELCEYDKTYAYDVYGNPSLFNGQHAFSYCPYSTCISSSGICNSGPYQFGIAVGVLRGSPKNKFYKDKWQLSKIINPITGKEILFEYEDYAFDREAQTVSNAVGASINGVLKQNMTLMMLRHKGLAKRLKKITCSQKESIEFEYSNTLRIDLPFEKILDKIIVKYDEKTAYSWNFSYGYFVKNSIMNVNSTFSNEERNWSRLCLLSVQKKGFQNLGDNPHSFGYYMGNEDNINSAIPPMFAFSHDSWGYYNATISGFYDPITQSVAPSNAPYEPYDGKILPLSKYKNLILYQQTYRAPSIEARNGILKSIKLPSGGLFQFDFEQNTNIGNVNVGGVRVKKTTLYDGENHQNDIVKNYTYLTESGNSSGWGYEPFIYSYTDDSYYTSTDDGRSGVNIPQIAIGAINSFNAGPPRIPAYYQYAIRHKIDIPKGINPVINYIGNIAFNALLEFIISLGNQPQNHFVNTNYSSIAYNSQNLLPFQYSRVIETSMSGNDNIGKVISEFTSVDDYTLEVPTFSLPFSNKERLANWQYGLLKRQYIYDKNNVLIQKQENEYIPTKYWLVGNNNLSRKWAIKNKLFATGFISVQNPFNQPWPTDDNTDSELYVETYYPLCGRIELTRNKKYVYNSNNEYTLFSTEYAYNATNYLPKQVISSNSKGELVETNTYYPDDYSLSGPLQLLKNNNIINVPVSSQTFITKAGNQKYLLNGSVSEFGVLPNNDIKIIKTHAFQSDNPVISTSVTFSSTQLIPNNTYYKETGSIIYDGNGNSVQVNSDNGKVSSVYDYDNKLPVATVINATTEDIAYTSFETESLGGWSMNIGSTYVTDKSITGKRSLSGSINKMLIHPGNYTITLWCHSSSTVSVNSQTGNLLTTIGEWKLYEWKLNSVSNIQVTGGIIDEVRLYPSIARMNTITYDPMLGKISECDLSNRITYYEYDGLGRLKIVRDENKNVIKTYEYNYKQQ